MHNNTIPRILSWYLQQPTPLLPHLGALREGFSTRVELTFNRGTGTKGTLRLTEMDAAGALGDRQSFH